MQRVTWGALVFSKAVNKYAGFFVDSRVHEIHLKKTNIEYQILRRIDDILYVNFAVTYTRSKFCRWGTKWVSHGVSQIGIDSVHANNILDIYGTSIKRS